MPRVAPGTHICAGRSKKTQFLWELLMSLRTLRLVSAQVLGLILGLCSS